MGNELKNEKEKSEYFFAILIYRYIKILAIEV
jgi:hypothetical protein